MESPNLNRVIRPAAVAGMFYPSDPAMLAHDVDDLIHDAPAGTIDPKRIKAVAMPHAGYIYSGPTAAAGYSLLASRHGEIERVVLLGPAHRVSLDSLALPDVDMFETPLGRVPIDVAGAAAIEGLPQVVGSRYAHAAEHSLEVQLPFLQRVLGTFSLLPLAVGRASPEDVAEVLDLCWGGPETLIVISTDLSHFHPYREAVMIDVSTADQVLALRHDIQTDHACGAMPLNGFLLCAQRHGLKPHLIDLRNSGDTAGDRARVVGYASFAFTEGDDHG